MPHKRNIEDLSGSTFSPNKRTHVGTTDIEDGKVFLVLLLGGRKSRTFWEQCQIRKYLDCHFAKVIAFDYLEDAENYAVLLFGGRKSRTFWDNSQIRQYLDCHFAEVIAFDNLEDAENYAKQSATQAEVALAETDPKETAQIESKISERESPPREVVEADKTSDTRDLQAAVSVTEHVNSEKTEEIDDLEVQVAERTELQSAQDMKLSDHITVFVYSTIAKAKDEGARMSYGIYFGHNSPHNIAETANGSVSPQRADLTAAVKAIKVTVYRNLVASNGHIELRMSSKYVKKGIDSWMAKWKKLGWRNANRGLLKNADLWLELDALLEEIGRDRVTVRTTAATECVESFYAGRLAESAMRK